MSTVLPELITTVSAAVGAIVLASIPLLIDSAKNTWKKRFRQQVKSGIMKGNLDYNDMQHIAERWSQDRKSILFSLRIMHGEAVAGEDEKLVESLSSIRDLIIEHQKHEPFAELPENISLQLSQLKKVLIENEGDKVGQLAASLSELYTSNQYYLLKQKRLTFGGLVVGVLGLVVGAAGLYLSLSGV